MALSERFRGMTVGSALAARATADSGAPYLLYRDRQIPYGEVDGDSEALAASLANLGVKSGDRIALVLPPCPEFVTTLFAAAKIGAIVVPLNPRLTASELQYMLRHSEAVCAVTIEQAFGVDYLQLFETLMPNLPDLQYLLTVGEEDLWFDDRIFQFEDLVSAGRGRDFAVEHIPATDDRFAIVYTSGTMGKPKGVELSHGNLISIAAGSMDAFALLTDDRVVGITALFHVFGLGPGLLGTLLAGASVVLQDDSDAAATLDMAEFHRATVHYGIPSLYVGALQQLGRRSRDLSTLRLAVVSGAPVSDELVDEIRSTLGVPVLTTYSVTETASTVAATRAADPIEKQRFTVGKPLEGIQVRITEPTGELLPEESVGEIGVKGPGVMVGYYRQPTDSAAAFDVDGFFRTGDLGILDEEGYLHLVGRIKDVIIRSGFNVYPREVETRIESHPAVREVAAIGIPDPLLGEAICACVVPVEGAIVTGQEIVDWCRETLAEDKVPDSVRFLDRLPKTETGKVRRVELSREVLAENEST